MLEHLISLSDAATSVTATAGTSGTFLDKLGLGASIAVMGLAVVFAGLVSLIVITIVYPKILKALLGRSSNKKEKAASVKEAKATAPQKPEATPVVAASPADDDALIAVITAAIAASLGTSSNGVVVKSIERTGQNVPSWGARGRIEQVYNRF